MISETAKHRALVAPFCGGCGLDLGSGGDPIVPWAISVDLPDAEGAAYGTTHFGAFVELRGDATHLHWFRDGVLDWVYSSHLLEDFGGWQGVLREWMRVVKPGGQLLLLVPEVTRWAAAVAAGQPCNCHHVHEFTLGEISHVIRLMPGWEVVEERLAAPEDYSIFVHARRLL